MPFTVRGTPIRSRGGVAAWTRTSRTPAAEGRFSGLWAEVALDGLVLLEREWSLSEHLARVRRAIAAGRLVRRVVHGQPYWRETA